jgi:hypothetical protein
MEDKELDRLINAYGQAEYEMGRFVQHGAFWQDACQRALDLRMDLYRHLWRHYDAKPPVLPDGDADDVAWARRIHIG